MKHILLTGAVQVGKSTALRTFLKNSGYSADGYRTYWKDRKSLFIAPFGTDEAGVCAAITVENRRTAIPEAFEYGAELIKSSGQKQIIVFDELGRLEQCSESFMQAVYEKLGEDKQILGVIKAESNPFLNKIREMPNVTILEVTKENREQIPQEIERMMI